MAEATPEPTPAPTPAPEPTPAPQPGPSIIPATPAPAPAPEPTPTTLEKLLSGELFKAIAPKGYGGAEDLAKGYLELEGKIGAARTVVPTAESSAETWEEFWKAAGRPEAADKYTLADPQNGMPRDEGFEGWLRETLFAAGNNQQQAEVFHNAWSKFQLDRAAELKATTDKDIAGLKSEWPGDKWDVNVDAGRHAIALGAGQDAQAVMQLRLDDGSFLMDHPQVVRMMSALGHKLGEAGVEPAGATGVGGITTPAAARAEIARLKADPDFGKSFMTKGHPEHDASVQKMTRLNALAAS